MSDEVTQPDIIWPRDIWAAERKQSEFSGEHVFSEHATVSRWDEDIEREREFHRYVDADVLESHEKYHKGMVDQLRAELVAANARADCAWGAAIEASKGVCIEQAQAFASPEYATNQPLSSFGERFACAQCEDGISLLHTPESRAAVTVAVEPPPIKPQNPTERRYK